MDPPESPPPAPAPLVAVGRHSKACVHPSPSGATPAPSVQLPWSPWCLYPRPRRLPWRCILLPAGTVPSPAGVALHHGGAGSAWVLFRPHPPGSGGSFPGASDFLDDGTSLIDGAGPWCGSVVRLPALRRVALGAFLLCARPSRRLALRPRASRLCSSVAVTIAGATDTSRQSARTRRGVFGAAGTTTSRGAAVDDGKMGR